jgi:hypothetical protein
VTGSKRLWLTLIMLLGVLMGTEPIRAYAQTAAITVPTAQLLFMPQGSKEFNVIQVLSVKNSTTVAKDVHLYFPNNAKAVAVQGVKDIKGLLKGHQIVLRHWAKPEATTKVTFTYSLPLTSGTSVQLTLHSAYAVYMTHIYIPIGNTALSATGLMPDTQAITIGGTHFRVFSKPGIQPGQDYTLSLSLLPQTTSPDAVKGLPIIGLQDQLAGSTIQAVGNLLIAAIILIVGLLSIRSTQYGKGAQRRLSQPEALYAAWEATERDFQAGRLEQEDYEQRRNQFKHKLVQLSTKSSRKTNEEST